MIMTANGLYQNPYGLLNQITAAPNTNLGFNYEYIKSTFAPLDSIKESIVPRNYKLLKRNRYLKLI